MASVSSRLEEMIRQATRAVVKQITQTDDAIVQAVVGREGERELVINNSFLSRTARASVKTLQSSRRLSARLMSKGKEVDVSAVSVMDDKPIKSHYKVMPVQDTKGLVPLDEAIAQELARFGGLLFVLIGAVKGLRPHVQPVQSDAIKEIRLTPTMKNDFANIGEGCYAIKRILPIEYIILEISGGFPEGHGISSSDREAISNAYNKLLDAATTDVIVPTAKTSDPKETILGQIVGSLRSQRDEYRTSVLALEKAPEDRQALHDVLRIAYNFSTDVLPLMALFRSICDLKPLVFWCTVDVQWKLHAAFESLPWATLGRKESLQEYQGIVSQARNHAFHHVLPFEATVEIDLTKLDVRAETIRLFLPFGEKQGRGVRIQDQELADVLAEFSRARQRPVSITFWRENVGVMQAACSLAQRVLDSIILIHEARLMQVL